VSYDEVSVALFVRPRGVAPSWPLIGTLVDLAQGKLGTYIHRLPVTQTFTCEAGVEIWGFLKTVEEIAIEPRGGAGRMPEQGLTSYTNLHGVPHGTRAVMGGEGFAMRLGGAELVLGSHALANELRLLGLPRRALFTTWTEHMHASFELPEKL